MAENKTAERLSAEQSHCQFQQLFRVKKKERLLDKLPNIHLLMLN